MMRKTKYIAMALGAVLLLAGCNSKSPTAPKPTPVSAFNISLTPESSTALINTWVLVVAQVTSGSGNAPDGTSVTFVVSGGGVFVDDQGNPIAGNQVAATTSGGRAVVRVASTVPSLVTVTAGVPGGTARTHVTFAAAIPGVPTPTPTGPPDYTPNIYVLTPNAGPFQGGTRVTISGTGFQDVVQVLFDDIQAQVVSTSYTEVVCISPSITPTAPPTVITKQVTVTNIGNGKVSNGVGFRYGVTMFISSFSPMEGPADAPTTVTIFGQGFVAPVSVVATLGGQWDVLSVAGTEIVVRTKPLVDNPHACDGGSTTFTVTNINSNTSATSQQPFVYRGVHPLITSVQVDAGGNAMLQCGGTCAACVTAHTVTLRGSGFQPAGAPSTMTVTLEGSAGGSAGPFIATVLDANTMTISVTDLSGFIMATAPCTGGTRNVSTPIGVSVTNTRYDCSDTLNGALVIVPCDLTTCSTGPPTPTPTPTPAAPTVSGVAPNNGPISFGTDVIITGTNFVNSLLGVSFGGQPATGVLFLDATHIQATTPVTVTAASPVDVTVFCGGQNGTLSPGFDYTATMDVTIAGTGDVAASPAPFGGTSPCSSGTCNWVFNQSGVQLTASTTGTFSGWSGSTCGCTGTTNPCSVTMNTNRACTATFTP